MKKPVVAIVDDDAEVLASLAELLESAGYRTLYYTSGNALLATGLVDVDVLISDIGMPGLDGFQLCDLARRAKPRLPVFLITGRHEFGDHERAQGVSGFLRKPFDGHALLAAVRDALGHRQD